MALANPFCKGSRGLGVLDRQNHAAGGANGSIMVGIFVCLCLPSKKPSEREFLVPTRTDLGVKLLSPSVPPSVVSSIANSGMALNKNSHANYGPSPPSLAANVGVMSAIFPPHDDRHTDMSRDMLACWHQHVGNIEPCRLLRCCVDVVLA